MSRVRASLVAAAAIVAPGCFSPQIPLGLPCSDGEVACPSGQVCDTAADVCVPDSALGTWREDSAADFTDPTVILDDATIEPAGAIGPAPFFVEGVATFGIVGLAIGEGDEATRSYAELAALPTTGRGFQRTLSIDYDGEPPPGTGLADGQDITVRVEGEIYLPAGETEIALSADDRGFLDLLDPTTGDFERVVAADAGPDDVSVIEVPADGWYPFHAAFESEQGGMHLEILVGDPDDPGSLDDLEPARLRVRVDALAGLALDGFDDAYLMSPAGTTLGLDSPVNLDYGEDGAPADLGPLGFSSWSTRWAGQVLVEVPGSYTFRIDSIGGHRLWVDGEQLADMAFDGSLPDQTLTDAIDLDAGWHDLTLDLTKADGGPARVAIEVASGPELVDAFFPVERTRPVIGRGARWAYRENEVSVAIPDAGSATQSTFLRLPAGTTDALLVDLEIVATHPVQSSLGVALTRPGTAPAMIIDPGDLVGAGGFGLRLRFADVPGHGPWQVTGTDGLLDLATGEVVSTQIAATYAGGTPPFPTRAVYTSKIRELGGEVLAISGVRWQARQERDGGAVAVRVRSCDTAAACATEPWHDVASSGDPAGVPPRAFVQYQVELATGGDVPTGLDWIEIDYRLP